VCRSRGPERGEPGPKGCRRFESPRATGSPVGYHEKRRHSGLSRPPPTLRPDLARILAADLDGLARREIAAREGVGVRDITNAQKRIARGLQQFMFLEQLQSPSVFRDAMWQALGAKAEADRLGGARFLAQVWAAECDGLTVAETVAQEERSLADIRQARILLRRGYRYFEDNYLKTEA
jgi:hypothetical protein